MQVHVHVRVRVRVRVAGWLACTCAHTFVVAGLTLTCVPPAHRRNYFAGVCRQSLVPSSGKSVVCGASPPLLMWLFVLSPRVGFALHACASCVHHLGVYAACASFAHSQPRPCTALGPTTLLCSHWQSHHHAQAVVVSFVFSLTKLDSLVKQLRLSAVMRE